MYKTWRGTLNIPQTIEAARCGKLSTITKPIRFTTHVDKE